MFPADQPVKTVVTRLERGCVRLSPKVLQAMPIVLTLPILRPHEIGYQE